MYKMALVSVLYCLCIVVSGRSETGGLRSGSHDWKRLMERQTNNAIYNMQHPVQEHQKFSGSKGEEPQKSKKTFWQKIGLSRNKVGTLKK